MEVQTRDIDNIIEDLIGLCENLEDTSQWGLAAQARKIEGKLSEFNNSDEWRIYHPNYQSRACLV